MATTAGTIIRMAFETIGVLGEGQTLDAAKGADGLRRLNLMMSSLSVQPLTIPVVARETFAMTVGKGSPSNPYTIGDGANLNTARPATQNAIVGVGLILTSSDPDVEIPRTIYTDDAYQAIQVKDLEDELFTGLYYNPTYETTGFGKVFLWPVPDTADNTLVLYIKKQLRAFADQTTSYELPSGCEEALMYGLAKRLCAPYSVPPDPDVDSLARSTMGSFKRSNYHLVDLQQDPATTHDRRYGYDINVGNG